MKLNLIQQLSSMHSPIASSLHFQYFGWISKVEQLSPK